MKKYSIFLLGVLLIGVSVTKVHAQMMGGYSDTEIERNAIGEETAAEEREGRELWRKLEAKEISCENLSSNQFAAIGEYAMGLNVGSSHALMNARMIQMHGKEFEENMHIALGKRFSACDASVTVPGEDIGRWSFAKMCGGGPFFFGTNRLNHMIYGGMWQYGAFGSVLMLFSWALLIVGVVALVRWFLGEVRGTERRGGTALEILKERYAKGEIDKKEFEEKKKDLGV